MRDFLVDKFFLIFLSNVNINFISRDVIEEQKKKTQQQIFKRLKVIDMEANNSMVF